MKLDITAEDFARLSNEKKKKYIAKLFVRKSGAKPVPDDKTPIAYIMAGLPGAEKTEFLDTIAEEIRNAGGEPFVRIDLDEIVGVYPDYTPKDCYKFRSQGNNVLARTVDEARHGRYNILLDGTFSGQTGASVNTVTQLLEEGYRVNLLYMYDTAKSAWFYTQKRELETGRGIGKKGFIDAAHNLPINIRKVVELHSENANFSLNAVIQKELRDRDYYVLTQKSEIDNIIKLDYNVDNI
jgi:hypothetical protein